MGGILRRRQLLSVPSGGGGGGIDGYVTNGLILWLDGVYNTASGHDATATVWEDLSGNGHGYIYDVANVIDADHLTLNNRGGVKSNDFSTAELAAIHAGGTIELVVDFSDFNQANWCILPVLNDVGCTYRKNSDLCFVGRNDIAGKRSLTCLTGLHYYNNHLWRDGVEQENTLVDGSWGNKSSYLFSYRSAPDYPGGTAKVYAMRVYSRILSDSELMQNWLQDRARFGIS